MKKIIIAGVLGVIAIVLVIVFFVLQKKSTPFSDSDLAVVRSNVSSNENAFFILEAAAEKLSWPEDDKKIREIVDGESWDATLATEVLSDNTEALELFDKALLCAHLQIPEIQSFDEDFEYFQNWKRLSQLSVLRALALFHTEKSKTASDLALQIIYFGHRIQECEGIQLHYGVGSAVKQMGLHTLREVMEHSSLSCESLNVRIQELDKLYVNRIALTNVIKREYQVARKLVDDMASGKLLGSTKRGLPPVSGGFRPFFNPAATREIYADFARTGLKSIPLYYCQMPTNSMRDITNRSIVSFFLSGNAIGEILAQISAPSQSGFFSFGKCSENVSVAATQTIFALRCYKEKNGALPDSLKKLVPEFLPKIPVDDFDGRPLRYSAEKKLIYSVGPDLIDSGGKEKDTKNRLDILFKIEF